MNIVYVGMYKRATAVAKYVEDRQSHTDDLTSNNQCHSSFLRLHQPPAVVTVNLDDVVSRVLQLGVGQDQSRAGQKAEAVLVRRHKELVGQDASEGHVGLLAWRLWGYLLKLCLFWLAHSLTVSWIDSFLFNASEMRKSRTNSA